MLYVINITSFEAVFTSSKLESLENGKKISFQTPLSCCFSWPPGFKFIGDKVLALTLLGIRRFYIPSIESFYFVSDSSEVINFFFT